MAAHGRQPTTEAIRTVLAQLREADSPQQPAPEPRTIALAAIRALEAAAVSSLRPVFNLTGTVLHTNLGRAAMSEAAIAAVVDAMRSPVALEFDLSTGKRGERDDHVRERICSLTGAEDCVVVNNNAAAVMLALASLSTGKETIVSRGELIEIGGSFRIPDIMRRAGAKLREVGTTNRTHLADYSEAIGPRTGAIMKVHTSNYRIEGFTAAVSPQALQTLAREKAVPIIDDLGSGTLVDISRYGLPRERTVMDALREGADLVTFSGDKLLGGPQVGIVAGRKDLVRLCARNHLKRALRVDKLRLAALAATLKHYRDPERLPEHVPLFRYFTRSEATLRTMAERLRPAVAAALGAGITVEIASCKSQIGSGAMPLETMPSVALRLAPGSPQKRGALEALASWFRDRPVPIIGRLHDKALWLDLRCLDDEALLLAQLPPGAFAR